MQTTDHSPSVTIGLVPRERFSHAAETVRSIVAHTTVPYRLLVIDCNTPEPYRTRITQSLPDDKPVEVLRFEDYLLPNQSRNRIIDATDDEYVCLVDNDIIVEAGWLEHLLTACRETDAGVIRPLVFKHGSVHFDRRLGPLSAMTGSPGDRLRIGDWTRDEESNPVHGRRRVDWLEMHCLLFQKNIFGITGPFDEFLNTREHVDLSMVLQDKGIPIVFEPSSRVHFVPPPPVRQAEREFFSFRWDERKAIAANAIVRTKWDLARYRTNIDWVLARHSKVTPVRNLVGELRDRLAIFRDIAGRLQRELNDRRKRVARTKARRKFGNLAGLEGGRLTIPVEDKNTRYFHAGSVSFAVERRLSRHKDTGVSLHVFTRSKDGAFTERFRVDCLNDSPHYHYIFQEQGFHQKFWIDPLAVEDTRSWTLDIIRHRIRRILLTVGGPDVASLVDPEEVERVLPDMERAMRQAVDWTTEFGGQRSDS